MYRRTYWPLTAVAFFLAGLLMVGGVGCKSKTTQPVVEEDEEDRVAQGSGSSEETVQPDGLKPEIDLTNLNEGKTGNTSPAGDTGRPRDVAPLVPRNQPGTGGGPSGDFGRGSGSGSGSGSSWGSASASGGYERGDRPDSRDRPGRPSDPTPPGTPAPTSRPQNDSSKKDDEGESRPSSGKEDDQKGKKDEKKNTPQVWKQDKQRPTFARVYVGNGNSLTLTSMQVTVTIDGARARTLVDHVFHNPHPRQLEGTFEYPLPTGASPSYFAMFLGQTRNTVPPRFAGRDGKPKLAEEVLSRLAPVELVRHVSTDEWGRLQEAKIVNKAKALEVYEEVTRQRIDPALLEYSGGNTFSGRVFPIPANGYNRVLIAYEELLPVVSDKNVYRFSLPDCPLTDLQFHLHASAHQCKDFTFEPKGADKDTVFDSIYVNHSWKDKGPGGAATFAFRSQDPVVQTSCARTEPNGPLYLHARVRPELKVEKTDAFSNRAVFLLDTSMSESPDRFDVNMKLMRKILESDADIKEFNILGFNVGAAWLEPKAWLANDEAGRKKAFDRLDGLVLEGATDLSAAFNKLLEPGLDMPAESPLNVFLLSDGQITWGESDVTTLVARWEARSKLHTRFHCYRVGLGAENQELFESLTRKGGGIFNCYSDKDVAAAALAHRSQCLQISRVSIVGDVEASDLLVAGRQGAVYPGGELVLGARLKKEGKAKVVVEGFFLGKQVREEYPIEAEAGGELAPRAWAEIAVASLLALNDPQHDALVTAYCQQFGIGSKVASFLVLENESEYKRFNLDQERGKTLEGDLSVFLDKVWKGMGQSISSKTEFTRFLQRIDSRVHLFDGKDGAHVKKLMELLTEKEYELPVSIVAGGFVSKKDSSEEYLKALNAGGRDPNPYLTEARRRLDEEDADGAVRALSSIIEQMPKRGDALRLVGYRLLDLKQPAQASHLFLQVQRDRPFEPHSYRDLARSLEDSNKFGLAALQYEIVLSGQWHNRFRDDLKRVVHEEYVRMMREAIRQKAVKGPLADHFGERVEQLATHITQADLRVTISWNTDNTDVDLWVFEPDGTKCFYSNPKTKNGGQLSQDQTQGYGPERYQVEKAQKGKYVIAVNYFSTNPNLLAGESHVNVAITRFAGTPQEESLRRTVILKDGKSVIEVAKIEFKQ